MLTLIGILASLAATGLGLWWKLRGVSAERQGQLEQKDADQGASLDALARERDAEANAVRSPSELDKRLEDGTI